ncbi:MAG: alpha/beta fold hydrolase [Gammaproteobacteria bacterium]|nr:alpha/beta fold hydrolase [Gammaproteobacteria bacterium]
MLLRKLLASGLLILFTTLSHASQSTVIEFKSADNLLITADSYFSQPTGSTPIIVLFHQAGSSRGEYNEITPRLNQLGFNCIAVDLRSGEYSRGKDNETAMRASNAGLSTNYADALPDIIATLEHTRKQYKHNKIIAWGSSYSASLVLKVAGDHPQLVDAVLAFSPGEYFSHIGKSKTWIRDSAKNIKVPTFITSSKDEADSWKVIYEVIPSTTKTGFIPATAGRHGSRALWNKYIDSEKYWQAVIKFLNSARL